MYRIKKNKIFLNMYKMLKISVKEFTDVKVQTITIGNTILSRLKMWYVQ